MKKRLVNLTSEMEYKNLIRNNDVFGYDPKKHFPQRVSFIPKITKFNVKVAYFDLDPKCKLARFSDDEGNYLEFIGKKYIMDFIKEIKQKKYRGVLIFPLENDTNCVHLFYKYLRKNGYDADFGMLGRTCIYIKLYQQKYFSKTGSISHSNVVTLMCSGA